MKDKNNYQDSSETWSLSQEREFLENILCQRVNFLLVFYSLVIAGAFATHSQDNFKLAFTLGAVITFLFTMPIARVQHRLDSVLCMIKKQTPGHPAIKTDDWITNREGAGAPWPVRLFVRKSRRGMVGYWIPLLCSASLWIAAVSAWVGWLEPK